MYNSTINKNINDLINNFKNNVQLSTARINSNTINSQTRSKLWDIGFSDKHIMILSTRDNNIIDLSSGAINILRDLLQQGVSCEQIVTMITNIDIDPKKIQAAETIVRAWRRYRDLQKMCSYNLVADLKFQFQGQEYSTVCPISLEVMRNPKILTTRDNNGVYKHIVDESSIKNWFKRSKTNPFNKIKCSELDLSDFIELKDFIIENCDPLKKLNKRARLGESL